MFHNITAQKWTPKVRVLQFNDVYNTFCFEVVAPCQIQSSATFKWIMTLTFQIFLFKKKNFFFFTCIQNAQDKVRPTLTFAMK